MSDWCILRTSSGQTLNLAKSLTEAGYEVWTPVEIRSRLAGRKREMVEQEIVLIPQYVFARFAHLTDLLALSHSPTLNYRVWDAKLGRIVAKGHPHFTVFRENGSVRPLSDECLASLRSLEGSLQKAAERRKEQAKQKGPTPQFRAGQVVTVQSGGFEGLSLVVAEDNDGKDVKLTHPNWMWTVEISAWKLQQIQLEQALPEQGAALAA